MVGVEAGGQDNTQLEESEKELQKWGLKHNLTKHQQMPARTTRFDAGGRRFTSPRKAEESSRLG